MDMTAQQESKLKDFCRGSGIRKLQVFGSVARGDDKPDSDIDLLVEFEPESEVTLLDLVRMERELSAIMGRKADLLTLDSISPYIREEALSETKTLYEAR